MSSGQIECRDHGWQLRAATSPRIAAAARNKTPISASAIVELVIEESFDDPVRVDRYFVDSEFLGEAFGAKVDVRVTLVDRDRATRHLNDRLLILRITKKLEGVCPRCLELVTGRPTPAPGWKKDVF